MLLLEAMQQIAKYKWHLSNLVAFLRLNLFVKMPLYDYLNERFIPKYLQTENIPKSLFT
ncbi:MAG: hypothetical protein H6605_00025 [Flavobacteriales bacterium]|nr:hypothetical protein [Flavobacteriales bacterium]